ncbi:MAG TPA: beta-glucosidase [Verrucomicrobia bacterium]|nr:beta-glucosidase [Verrucomicrobiota bacterium]HPU57535.1 beta-glucosidase [Verrucomicrobiota bacterium]
MGGFECSTHRLRSGRRLDLIAATRHEEFAMQDYQRMRKLGLLTAREGLRWHIVEQTPGRYDFSSAAPVVEAARENGVQVIWDLCHFGWPDHLDIFKPDFVTALAAYGRAFAQWLHRQTGEQGFFVPVNEISFFSWAAGDEGSMYPFATGRGFELKTQLVRAALAVMDAIWEVAPGARFVHVDPIIHVVAAPRRPEEREAAEAYRLLQFQAWDMLSGRLWPELGGHEKYLDIVGVNFYPHNQWFYNLKGFRRIRKFTPISQRHPLYRPFRDMLSEMYRRYHRPILIAETGAEEERRVRWLRYVCRETSAAIASGIPVHGICLYPILNHPGWVDGRHCHNALWDYPDDQGRREIYAPLAAELRRWQKHFAAAQARGLETDEEQESVTA